MMILEVSSDLQLIALLAINKKGYSIKTEKSGTLQEIEDGNGIVLCIAEKTDYFFRADNFIELLGVIELGEFRGDNWELEKEEDNHRFLVEQAMINKYRSLINNS